MPANNQNLVTDPTLPQPAGTPNTFLLWGDGTYRPVWQGSIGEVDPGSGLAFIAFDAVVSLKHSSEVVVTEHPVEKGSDVTDLARPKPDTLIIDGFISDAPIDRTWGQYVTNQTTSSLGNQSTNPNGGGFGTGRARTAFALLHELKNNSTVFNVNTTLNYYTNMVISSLDIPQDSGTGGSLKVTISLKALRIISSQTVAPLGKRGTNAKKSGGTKTTAAVAPATQKTSSLAYKGVTGIEGLIKSATNQSGGQ